MIELLTLITLMCTQPGVGNGSRGSSYERIQAFTAQSQCIKRLYAACGADFPRHNLRGSATDCLVKAL